MFPANSKQSNYYDILGLDLYESNQEKIKKAYRKASLQVHPDKTRNNPDRIVAEKELDLAKQELKKARVAFDAEKMDQIKSQELEVARKKLLKAETNLKNIDGALSTKFKVVSDAYKTLSNAGEKKNYDDYLKSGSHEDQNKSPLRESKETQTPVYHSNSKPFKYSSQEQNSQAKSNKKSPSNSKTHNRNQMPQDASKPAFENKGFTKPTVNRDWAEVNSEHKEQKTPQKAPKEMTEKSDDSACDAMLSKQAMNDLQQQYFVLLTTLILLDMMLKNSLHQKNHFSSQPIFIVIEVASVNAFNFIPEKNSYNSVASLFQKETSECKEEKLSYGSRLKV